MIPNSRRNVRQTALLISGLLLIAVNLRPSITGLAPLAERMYASGMSRQAIGMLTTLPLIVFGLASTVVGVIGNRIGFARTIGFGLVLLAGGCFLRSWQLDNGPSVASIVGSILIGAGIATGNVLLPGIVKSRFPNHVGSMTSIYSTAMNLGGSLGLAMGVPLANGLSGGWQASMSSWGYAAVVPLVIWIPQICRKPIARTAGNSFVSIVTLIGSARAWQVTVLMSLQSLLFYSCVGWLPTILQMRGLTETDAAAWPTAMQLCGCVASLVVPTFAGRARHQSGWVVACGLTNGLSILGILWLPQAWAGFATLGLGVGLNVGFSLSLLLIAMRSKDAPTVGNLSSMAQTFGYLAAAPFPWFIGWLSAATGSWTIAFGSLVLPAGIVALVGWFAGREGHV